MTEPSSTALAATTVTGVTLVGLLTSLDADTLLGAASGSSLFVISARDHGLFTRLVYWCIALGMGYKAGPALLQHVFETPSVSAFVFSACCINLAQQLIANSANPRFFKWFKS
ncbi:putative holin [Teredinibacter turnerae]|uniref:putative holin n=1 Tax=Teredinibacter turnerae TaxID=2426 RepID=UPI00036318ED|nr:putative holin [Teredinibacter turnerae]